MYSALSILSTQWREPYYCSCYFTFSFFVRFSNTYKIIIIVWNEPLQPFHPVVVMNTSNEVVQEWASKRSKGLTHLVPQVVGRVTRGSVLPSALHYSSSFPRYTVLRLMIRQRLEEIAETPATIWATRRRGSRCCRGLCCQRRLTGSWMPSMETFKSKSFQLSNHNGEASNSLSFLSLLLCFTHEDFQFLL